MANGPGGAAPSTALYVPARCQRVPNATHDRAFGIWLCDQRDARCCHFGPAYVLDEDGRRYECHKRDAR
jgi:hypothetical protein